MATATLEREAYRQEKKDLWDSRLVKVGALFMAAGLGLAALKLPGAGVTFKIGLIAFGAGLAWNFAFGKKR